MFITFVIDTSFDRTISDKIDHINMFKSLSNLNSLNYLIISIDYFEHLETNQIVKDATSDLNIVFKYYGRTSKETYPFNHIADMLRIVNTLVYDEKIIPDTFNSFVLYLGTSGMIIPGSKLKINGLMYTMNTNKLSAVDIDKNDYEDDLATANLLMYSPKDKLKETKELRISASDGSSRNLIPVKNLASLFNISYTPLINHRFDLMWWPIIYFSTFPKDLLTPKAFRDQLDLRKYLYTNMLLVDYDEEFFKEDYSKLNWFRLLFVYSFVLLNTRPEGTNIKDVFAPIYEEYISEDGSLSGLKNFFDKNTTEGIINSFIELDNSKIYNDQEFSLIHKISIF